MIAINLLPPELRPKEVRKLNIPVVPILLAIFLIFVLASLFNLFIYIQKRAELRNLETKWESLKAKNTEAENLQRELGLGIKAEVNFYDTIIDPPLEVARVLDIINDLIPANVWLSDLKFDRRPEGVQIVLDGFSEETQKGLDLVIIQNFANSLKDKLEQYSKPQSSKGLFPVKPFSVSVTTSSAQKEVRGTSVTQFTITCQQS